MWKKTRKTCHSLSILGCSYSLSLFRFAMNDQSELYFIVVIKLVLLAVAVYYKCYRCQGSNVILNDITHYLFCFVDERSLLDLKCSECKSEVTST